MLDAVVFCVGEAILLVITAFTLFGIYMAWGVAAAVFALVATAAACFAVSR